MTNEEHIEQLKKLRSFHNGSYGRSINMAIEALKFAQWVAEEVIDEDLWELNHGAFGEIACRKLEKLGIVRAKSDEWELIESEDEKMIGAGYKSAYQQGYSDAMRDFRKKSKTNVLDKIRAEIALRNLGESSNICIKAYNDAINDILQIIDKYKSESEDKK